METVTYRRSQIYNTTVTQSAEPATKNGRNWRHSSESIGRFPFVVSSFIIIHNADLWRNESCLRDTGRIRKIVFNTGRCEHATESVSPKTFIKSKSSPSTNFGYAREFQVWVVSSYVMGMEFIAGLEKGDVDCEGVGIL